MSYIRSIYPRYLGDQGAQRLGQRLLSSLGTLPPPDISIQGINLKAASLRNSSSNQPAYVIIIIIKHLGSQRPFTRRIMARPDCPLFPILHANPGFFSLENDISGFGVKAPRLRVPPIGILRRCASQGCDLCRVLTAGSTEGFKAAGVMPFQLEYAPTHLSRAMSSHHEQITLYSGVNDLLPPTSFFRIPSPWSKCALITSFHLCLIFTGVVGVFSGLTKNNRGCLATGPL